MKTTACENIQIQNLEFSKGNKRPDWWIIWIAQLEVLKTFPNYIDSIT